jgi:hypothetical protein
MRLATVQRSSVILMDALGYSLDEIGAIMDASLPAVKSALHRGRRDDDAVRAMLAEEVRLDLVNRRGALKLRYQRCEDAIRAPSTIARNFAHATVGSTVLERAEVAKPQSVPAVTRSRPTTDANCSMRSAT